MNTERCTRPNPEPVPDRFLYITIKSWALSGTQNSHYPHRTTHRTFPSSFPCIYFRVPPPRAPSYSGMRTWVEGSQMCGDHALGIFLPMSSHHCNLEPLGRWHETICGSVSFRNETLFRFYNLRFLSIATQ